MIKKTFKLTICTKTKKEMEKEEQHLSMVYGAEEVESENCEGCKYYDLRFCEREHRCETCNKYWGDKYVKRGDEE